MKTGHFLKLCWNQLKLRLGCLCNNVAQPSNKHTEFIINYLLIKSHKKTCSWHSHTIKPVFIIPAWQLVKISVSFEIKSNKVFLLVTQHTHTPTEYTNCELTYNNIITQPGSYLLDNWSLLLLDLYITILSTSGRYINKSVHHKHESNNQNVTDVQTFSVILKSLTNVQVFSRFYTQSYSFSEAQK